VEVQFMPGVLEPSIGELPVGTAVEWFQEQELSFFPVHFSRLMDHEIMIAGSVCRGKSRHAPSRWTAPKHLYTIV
jgi:hypothetical protein